MESIRNFDLLSVGITIAAIGILGFIVFINNRRSATNRAFLFLVVATILYGAFNYISYRVADPNIGFWILRITIFFSVWHSFSMFLFFYVFPREEWNFKKWFKFGLIPLVTTISLSTLTPLVFESVAEVSDTGRILKLNNGPGIVLFGSSITLLILGGFWQLIKKTVKAHGTERIQFSFILVGALISFSLLIIFNFIFPALIENATFVPLAGIFMLPFIAFTFYAILKHGLLRVKVVAAEILTFFLAVITLFEILLSDSLMVVIFRAGIFFLVLVFGILLIRSVLREVQQREKLEKLTKELELANDKLKELDHMKSEFLSLASHQIKAPLAAIKGFATLIYDGTYGQTPEKVNDAAHKIKDSADRMVQLVGDFLNVRKIEEGKMQYKFERVDVVKIISSIFEELKPLADNKKLNFSLEPLPGGGWINADAQNIRQAFQNLIENSIKYTDTGFVKVRTESITGKFIFSVSDSGHGISQELLPHLFEEFRRDPLTSA